jgi:DNA-binding GntR family transcriptional regulator
MTTCSVRRAGMARKLVFTSLRDQLVEAIQEAIITNQYTAGQEIQIDKLASDFGVSTTPVREALAKLEGDGLIRMVPNRGPQVAPIHPDDVRNVWEMRRIMEPYAAERAADKCTQEEIEAIDRKLHYVLEHPEDFQAYMNSDFELHNLLFQHVENQIFHETLERIRRHSARIRYYAEGGSERYRVDVVRQVITEHLTIVEAIKDRDASRAARLLTEHLINGEDRTLRAVMTCSSRGSAPEKVK